MEGVLPKLDVCAIVDRHRFNGFTFRIVVICFFVVLFEGYDIAAMAFALPGLAKDWQINDIAMFGPVLGASMIGMMIGSAAFGYWGDRSGRRIAIISACLIFALFTGLIIFAINVTQLALLRLIAGIGMGGAVPNAIALTSEYAPIERRSFIVTVMFSGIGLGGALPGLAATFLMASHGWHALFVIGCILPLAVVLVCLLWLPESPNYLMLRGRNAETLALLHRLAPDAVARATAADLEIGRAPEQIDQGFRALFRHGFAPSTLLFWAAVIGNFMTYYVLLNWTPTFFTISGLQSLASIGQMVFQFGGVAGGIAVGLLLGRRGPAILAGFMLFATVPTILLGLIGGDRPALLLLAEFSAGFGILGTAYGFGALAAMIYPASIRSNGAGCGLGAGRFGSILSTIAAGQFVASGMPIAQIFLIAAIPLLIAGLACLALARQSRAARAAIRPALQAAH